MSPRRNARALAPRPKRQAASGKTRALGQHFLRDDTVAERMVALVQPTQRDLVVEIGPGLGALTGRLARAGGRLLALEVDEVMARALIERFADAAHVEVSLADARSFDYSKLSALKPDPTGRVFYIGPNGNDGSAGTSRETAWKTFGRVSGLTSFAPPWYVMQIGTCSSSAATRTGPPRCSTPTREASSRSRECS